MRAQVTIFMILGIVILTSVIGMFMLASSAQQEPAQSQIDEREMDPQTCLVRSTRLSINSLQDQGVITTDEYGPMPEEDKPYVYLKTEDETFVQGRSNYYGLCSRTGVNRPAAGRFLCPSSTYSVSNRLSIQEQLQYTITQRMHQCLQEPTGRAEVIMQQDAIQVRYDNPRAQHNERTPLTSTWAAIEVFLREQRFNTTYALEQEYIRGCNNCQSILVSRENKAFISGSYYDNYTFSHQQQVVASILLEDRGIIQNISENDEWRLEIIEDGLVIPTGVINEEVTIQLYAFDNDTLTLRSDTSDYDGIDINLERPYQDTRYILTINPSTCGLYQSDIHVAVTDGYGNTKSRSGLFVETPFCEDDE